MIPSSLSRRQVLALAVGASLAGCNTPIPGTGPKKIAGEKLARVASQEAPQVPETLPVPIESSFVATQADTARRLLGEVPGPFDAEEIPNGVIRERLNRQHRIALEHVRTWDEAATPLERLHQAGEARIDARGVWATWRAIDADLTTGEVREQAPAVRDDVAALADRWSYLGNDPVRAVRAHAAIESDLQGARNWADLDSPRRDGPFAVGELARNVERARVDVATAGYLFDRFRESLDHAGQVQERLKRARQTLNGRIRERTRTLPDVNPDEDPTVLVDRQVGKTAGVWALAELYESAQRHGKSLDRNEAKPRLAIDILERHRGLVVISAFERLRARIEGGDDIAIDDAADVAAMREAAVSAVATARQAAADSGLVREALPGFVRRIRWTDEQLNGRDGPVPVPGVARDANGYVAATATCRALPDASDEVAAVLRGV